MSYNTIILLRGERKLTDREYQHFTKGETIYGEYSNPKEICRWPIENKEAAKEELKKYNCEYNHGNDWNITEYALQYCTCDEDGEFCIGCDYDFAEEK